MVGEKKFKTSKGGGMVKEKRRKKKRRIKKMEESCVKKNILEYVGEITL